MLCKSFLLITCGYTEEKIGKLVHNWLFGKKDLYSKFTDNFACCK